MLDSVDGLFEGKGGIDALSAVRDYVGLPVITPPSLSDAQCSVSPPRYLFALFDYAALRK